MVGGVPVTKLRDGTEEDDAEVTAWAKSSRPRHQNGSHMAQRCYMSKESTGETLTGAGDEERCSRPIWGNSEIQLLRVKQPEME